jgi:hypothetical protein
LPASNAAESLDRLLKECPLCTAPILHDDAAAPLKEYLLYQSRLRLMVSFSSTVSQMISSGSVVAKTCWRSIGYSDCSLCYGIISSWSPFDVVGFHHILYVAIHESTLLGTDDIANCCRFLLR